MIQLSRLRRFLPTLSPQEAKIFVCVLTALIAVVDFSLPDNIDIASFYFICVVLLIWTRSVTWLWTCTGVLVLLTFGGITLAPSPILYTVTWVDWLNRSFTALALIVTAVPVHLRLRAFAALEHTMSERDRAQRALRDNYENLEARVQERTRELQAEVAERVRTEDRLRDSELAARRLSVRLISAQEEERRHIARELHDSVGQYLAHSKMSLQSWLQKEEGSNQGMRRLAEIADNLDRCLTETRTISYLLHPPLLDELGFGSAARVYVEGFSQRSGIRVDLNIPPELDRLEAGLELVLFRVLQEGLTNVLRHAQSPIVEVQVQLEGNQIALSVRDRGKGMPPEIVERLKTQGLGSGVGLSGMRERVLEFHGIFQVESGKTGTLIRVMLPLLPAASVESEHESDGPADSRVLNPAEYSVEP